mmetsp:Transcript_52058/g.137534  ORF Transcript_52058/g.137534 Transcript_52058/m.137534 type:complete len:230 (+) Transcript_52058:51-740(+)
MRPTRPPSARAPLSAPLSAAVLPRPRAASTSLRLRSTTASATSLGNFFDSVDRELRSEWQDLAEEEQALQTTLRMRRKAGLAAPTMRGGLGGGGGAGGRRGRSGTSVPPPPKAVGRGPERTPRYLAAWEQHDQDWARFHDGPPASVSVGDVPWPPCSDDVLEFCEKLQAPGEPKLAYRIACRRWHPDKFLQHFGSRVDPEELPELTARLNEVFHAVNEQWERQPTVRVR